MSFTRTTPVRKTRKPHRCAWCGELIPAGSQAVSFASHGWDWDFSSGHMHPECNRACEATIDREREPVELTGDRIRGRTDDWQGPPEFSTSLEERQTL